MGGVGGGQDVGAFGSHGVGVCVVDVSGGVQAESAVVVLFVVPAEERLPVDAGGLDRGELPRKVGTVYL